MLFSLDLMRARTFVLLVVCLAAVSANRAEQFPFAGLIFEYTVAPDGTRQNLHIVKIEQPMTHIDLSSELTLAEKSRGVRIVSHRKRVPAKDAGRKLYEVAVFDLRSRKYITDE